MLWKPDQIGLYYCNSRKLLILLHACHSQMKIYGHMVMKDALYEKLYCGELAKSSITIAISHLKAYSLEIWWAKLIQILHRICSKLIKIGAVHKLPACWHLQVSKLVMAHSHHQSFTCSHFTCFNSMEVLSWKCLTVLLPKIMRVRAY